MQAWKRICCPIDFSPVSRAAMETALDLARRFGAAVTLLHVDDAPAPYADATLASADALRMRSLERDHQLAAWRDAAARDVATPVDAAVATGDPAAEIVRCAEEGFDAVVMGTHGRGARGAARLGSVAQQVIFDAPCPVVVVNARGAAAARQG